MVDAKSQWTLATLKELLEGKLDALSDQCEADKALLESQIKQLIAERDKQAVEYERRLTGLNHEATRINENNAQKLAREVWEQFVTSYSEWKLRTEAAVNAAVPQSEFRAYKDSTSRALQVEEGSRAGIKVSASTIVSSILTVAAVVGIVVAVSTWNAKTTPAPIIYLTPSVGGTSAPTTTTTTTPR